MRRFNFWWRFGCGGATRFGARVEGWGTTNITVVHQQALRRLWCRESVRLPKYVDRLGRNVRQKIGNCRVGSGASGPIDRILRFNGLQISDVITTKQKTASTKTNGNQKRDQTKQAKHLYALDKHTFKISVSASLSRGFTLRMASKLTMLAPCSESMVEVVIWREL